MTTQVDAMGTELERIKQQYRDTPVESLNDDFFIAWIQREMKNLSEGDLGRLKEWLRIRGRAADRVVVEYESVTAMIEELRPFMKPGEAISQAAHRIPPDLRSRLDYYYEKAEAAEVFFEAW